MKVLVIGATGLLGKPVVNKLAEAGYSLRLFSRNIENTEFNGKHEVVSGDVFNHADLDRAMTGCDAVHISISRVDEADAVKRISEAAVDHDIQLITYVSGATVSEENRWFPMIDGKFRAEEIISKSGTPYIIFRPTWFFESLSMMVRNGKAAVPGKQPHAYHWIAAEDFASMVVKAYHNLAARNRIFYTYGPEPFVMKPLLEKYCAAKHPEIKKVSETPLGMLRFISLISGNKMLKQVAAMFDYFSKVEEPALEEDPSVILGKPQLTFEKWMDSRA